jgi:signal transduction histidine kinase
MPALVRMIIATSLLASTATLAIGASDHGSREEAKALLERALAHIDAVGKQQAYADFSRRDGGFVDRDLYVYCFDMKGNNVAHGSNPAVIGMSMLDVMDADGVHLISEMIRVIQTSGQGWVDYKWPNPVTKKIESKSSFVRKAADDWCGVGYYKN